MPTLDEAIGAATPDPLAAAVDSLSEDTRRSAIYGAVRTNPDEYGKAMQLSRVSGVPAAIVHRNMPDVQQRTQMEALDAAIDSTSVLARQMESHDFANLAHDDVANLKALEEQMQPGRWESIKNSFRRGLPGLQQTYHAAILADRASGLQQLDTIERKLGAGEALTDAEKTAISYDYTTPEQRAALITQRRAALGAGVGTAAAGIATTEAEKRAIPQPLVVGRAMATKTFSDALTEIAKDPIRFIGSIGPESMISSAPGMALAVPATAYGGPAAGAAAIGANSFYVDYASSILDAFGGMGVDTSDPDAVRAAAQDPKKLAAAMDQAVKHASVVGGVDALSAGLASKIALPRAVASRLAAKPVARELANMAVQTPVQGMLGAAGEAGGELAAGQEIQPGNILAEAFGELAGAPVEVATMAQERIRESITKARQATQAGAALTELSKLSAESKVRPRDVQSFEGFVQAANEGGAVQDVYLDVQAMQQAGVPPEAIAALSPTAAAQMTEAIATGGDLVIPVSEYAGRIAGSEIDAALLPHLRTAEDALSMDEAQRFFQSQEQETRATAAKVMEEHATDDAFQASAKAVETQLFDQLKSAGRFTNDVNTAYSTLMRDFYVTTADRLGLTPEEAFARYPLQIKAESVVSEQQLNQPPIAEMSPDEVQQEAVAAVGQEEFQRRAQERFADMSVDADVAEAQAAEAAARDIVSASRKNSRVANAQNMGDNTATAQNQGEQNGQPRTNQPAVQANQEPATVGGGTPRMGWAEATRIRSTDGKPVTVYRGADRALGAGDFETGSLGHATGNPSSGLGVWFTANRDDAAGYGNVVEPFFLDIRNPKVYRDSDIPAFDSLADAQKFARELQTQGYDGIAVDYRGLGGPLHLVAFSPDTVINPPAPKPLGLSQFFQSQKVEDYGMEHRPPGPDDGAPLHDLTGGGAVYPDDVYSKNGPRYYGTGDVAQDAPVFRLANMAKGNPDFDVTIFRAVPANLTEAEIGPGDWVTVNRTYAENHGEGFDEGSRIISKKVKASEIFTNGDSIQEWGYWPADSYQQSTEAQGNNRGEISFGRDITQSPSIISLFKNADLSTFLHEMGHFQLEVLANIASRPDAPQGIVDDMTAALNWFGIGGTKEPARKPGFIRVYHSGVGGEGQTGRWVSTSRRYAADYRKDLPLYYTDIPANDPRVNNPDYPDTQGVAQGFTFNFELTPKEATSLREIDREGGQSALERWNALPLEEKRPYHEQFARGFEAYLFEGKAPSAELRSLFQRFRAWLTAVYRSATTLGVDINDDIRGVFNRLLASEDAIKAAEEERSYTPLFNTPEEMGDTQQAWAEYERLGTEATRGAQDELQKRSTKDMQWLTNARNRVLKQLQRDTKEKRAAVEAEVRAEVQAQPVYAARRAIKAAEKDGKISTAALEEMYAGEGDRYALLDWKPLSDQHMTSKEGVHPDVVAAQLGFDSGDQMVREILNAQPEAEVVEGMTSQRLLERYGDIVSAEALSRAADEAIHNEARARFVATELKALSKAQGPVRAMTAAAKAFAENLIARKKVKDIKPSQHGAAEARAAKNAEKALKAGDSNQAAVEKRNQLVQNYATRAAYDAVAEIEKAVRYLRKFDSEGVRKSIDTEYTDQIDKLLERFDLRASVTNTEAAKRESLLSWVENQRQQGLEPDIPPELLSEAARKPYREMTLEELRGLVDTVKQIEHLGRLKQKLLTAKDEREFKAVTAEISQSIAANANGRSAETRTPTDALGKLAASLKRFWASHIKTATWSYVMDGGEGGPMWEYFHRTANEKGDQETQMRADATLALSAVLSPIVKTWPKLQGKGRFFATVNRAFTREGAMALALNTGNESNLQRLLGGEGWTLDQIQPVLESLTAAEWHAVQAIWDHFESYRPEIGAKERRIYGKEPNWVEPSPRTVRTADGETLDMKGGYYPIKYDPAASQRAEEHADAEAAKRDMQGAYTAATTRRSFTKARAEEVTGRPLLYSLVGVYSGVNDVIHDLAWHEWLIDANRLLKNRSIDQAIRGHYGPEVKAQFKQWVQDVAQGESRGDQPAEVGVSWLRQGVSAAGMGFNVMSALMQVTGYTQSIVRVGPAYAARGLAQYAANPVRSAREVLGKSSFMEARSRTQFRELNELRNQVEGQSTAGRILSTGTYFMMMRMQKMVDVPTWLGAYEKAIAGGNNEDRSIALADQAVIDSQGSGMVKDLATVERGGPALKLFTVFYSFMNTALNTGVQAGMTERSKGKLAAKMLMLYTAPAVLGMAMKDALTPGDSGDDDPDKLTKKLIAEQLSYLSGLMVGVREFGEVARVVAGAEGLRGYSGPAGVRVVSDTVKAAQEAQQGEFDDGFRKASINLLGDLTGLPSAQINRTITGVKALDEGKTDNPAAVVLGYQKR